MGDHGFNLPAQTPGVKLEGVLALTIEKKIGINLHGSSPFFDLTAEFPDGYTPPSLPSTSKSNGSRTNRHAE
jgi:hypothetical protein